MDEYKKKTKDWIRHFTTKDIYIASKHMERCFTSLDIREIQLKTQWDTTCASSIYTVKI